jgi:hypothetical protein
MQQIVMQDVDMMDPCIELTSVPKLAPGVAMLLMAIEETGRDYFRVLVYFTDPDEKENEQWELDTVVRAEQLPNNVALPLKFAFNSDCRSKVVTNLLADSPKVVIEPCGNKMTRITILQGDYSGAVELENSLLEKYLR